MVARRFYKLFRHIVFRIRTRGRAHLGTGPQILVSNHVGSFGPISVMTSVDAQIRPWVAAPVTELASATDRIRREFVEGELHLKPPLSLWVARIVGRICVALMRDIGAIPVYEHGRELKRTMELTLAQMEQGRSVLVFPENTGHPVNEVLCDFRTGFIHLAREYTRRTRRPIAFLPVAVHPRSQVIRIGPPIPFDARAPFAAEKQRLKRELERCIYRLYREIDRERSA